MKNKNIFELWKHIGKITPFAARRQGWPECHYVIVEEIKIKKWPYGEAYGYPCENGKPTDHYNYNDDWKNNKEIPSAGSYQWELVLDANLSNLNDIKSSIAEQKLNSIKKAKVLSIGSVVNFGKYKGKTIDSIIEKDPGYVSWAIENVDSFIISPSLLSACKSSPFTRKAIEKNNSKIELQ